MSAPGYFSGSGFFSRKFCKDDGVLRVLYFFYLSNDPVFAGRFLRSRRPGACCAWFGERRRDCSTRWLVLGGFGVLFINPCVFFQIIFTVTTFEYVEGGPDREAPEVV